MNSDVKPCPKCGANSRLAAIGGDCLRCTMQWADDDAWASLDKMRKAYESEVERLRVALAAAERERDVLWETVGLANVRRLEAELVAVRTALGENVTPQDIVQQRAAGWPDFHPERYCHKCGRLNVWSWSVDSALWNEVAEPHVIWCPQCFTEAYGAKHNHTTWRLIRSDDDHACGVAGGHLADDTRREPEPTVEDYCGAGGHVYYGDDSGIGRCYCGAKTYPAAGVLTKDAE